MTLAEDYNKHREQMVAGQIAGRGVADSKVLAAMRTIPRHKFVPVEMRHEAYNDYPLPIGFGQTISQPYIVAYMTELLELSGSETVLEVGTGCGYQTAVLAEIARKVVTIDIIPELVQSARMNLSDYANIEYHCGDGWGGYEPGSPYGRILVTAAPESVPRKLVGQLADNGILVLPVGGRFCQQLLQIRKSGNELSEKTICGVVFVPLVHGK